MTRRKYAVKIKRHPDYWKPKEFKHYKTLGELASDLEKDPSWLRKLERRGTIPRPPTVKRGQLHIRLYSPENEAEIKEILKTVKAGRKHGT